jgi:threonylcarbamoyladenosine tRNA methylthiotransferase MtaB
MKFAFYTLGCKLNQSESEALVSSFDNRGFSISKAKDHADLYIVNSCTVTTKAEQKARRMIRKFARENPGSVVIVTGCYAQVEPEEVENLSDNVFVVSMDRKHTLLNLPDAIYEAETHGLSLIEAVYGFLDKSRIWDIEDKDRFKFDNSAFSEHVRPYLKIQDGCNNNCTYCRVTIARGNSVSLSIQEIVRRALVLENKGFKEIILTGVNITDYKDPDNPNFRLPDLVNALTASLKSVRIRLSSLEPDMIDRKLADAVSHKTVVPHFHIPVQSGSNIILSKIKRHYTSDKVFEAVKLLRSSKQDPFIAADLIVGLPGERMEDFEDSYDLIKSLNLSQLHIFPYSPRPGTALFNAADHVPERITGERIERIRNLASNLNLDYLQRWQGREVEVILEKYIHNKDKKSYWSGISQNYLNVRLTGLEGDNDYRGKLVRCRIESIVKGIECRLIQILR